MTYAALNPTYAFPADKVVLIEVPQIPPGLPLEKGEEIPNLRSFKSFLFKREAGRDFQRPNRVAANSPRFCATMRIRSKNIDRSHAI